LDTSFKEVFI